MIVALALPLPAQEMLWQRLVPGENYGVMRPFGDYDNDGHTDLLVGAVSNFTPLIRVVSGRDGSVLYDRIPPSFTANGLVSAGDFDLDGHLDYLTAGDTGLSTAWFEVWSPFLGQRLLYHTERAPACAGYGSILEGNLDLDGDGRPDLLVGAIDYRCAYLDAFANNGTRLYRIPLALPLFANDVKRVGDVDGDRADDFILGGVEWGDARGFVALFSGRTGTLIRVHFGEMPHDDIGFPLAAGGDVDGDGVPDYAAGNYFGGSGRTVVNTYSGRTGEVLRRWWTAPNNGSGWQMIAHLDVDLDGIPDSIASVPGLRRIHIRSVRDGQELVDLVAAQSTPTPYAEYMGALGVQPGNPYPVFVNNVQHQFFNDVGLQAWRCSPAGTRVLGTGCGTAGVPSIGVRRVEQTTGVTSRVLIGSAPLGAIAICLIAPAAATTSGGVSVPTSLDPLGLAGCTLLVPPDIVRVRIVGSAGYDRGNAAVDLPLPLVAAQGTQWAAQWLVLGPTNSAYAATARHEFRLQ